MNAAADFKVGRARRDTALNALESRRSVHVNRGRRTLLLHLLEHDTATADDVRAGVRLPDSIDPTCLGSVPGPLVKAGIIERVGFVPCVRPERHAAPTSLWGLVDRSKAGDWLQTHPDRDEAHTGQGELFPTDGTIVRWTSHG
ncbi:MAG: hypothetical protein IT364_02535 [Candidatus Hydrogenedentes bacterium]|nr:hypothetical protein [Candidatus Hydrogenedentota bacterium]